MGRLGVGLVALSCLAMASPAIAECLPTAVSVGDPAIVQSLGERLAVSGIAITATVGCPAVQVRIERLGEQLVLEITDSFSRRGRREVRDVATAAAIIESWTLQEIEQGTLPSLVASPEAAVTQNLAGRMAGPTLSRIGIAATFESSVGDNGSLWVGGTIVGCARLGPLCIGGVLRAATDTHASGETSGDSPHHGDELHALATVGLPRRLGSFVVSPGIGVGYGRLAIASTHLDMHMMPVSSSEASHELRGDVHVMISRPLGGRFAFYADVHGDAALARTQIAGGPRSFVRAAVGIRIEAP